MATDTIHKINEADPWSSSMKRSHLEGQIGSAALRNAVNKVVQREARAWGIRPDQAQSLLLDHKAIP